MTANSPALAPEFAGIAAAFHRFGPSPEECVRLLASVDETPASRAPVIRWRERLRGAGTECEGDRFERVLLSHAAAEVRPRLADLPVYEPVKRLLAREFDSWTAPARASHPPLDAAGYAFVAAAKTATLRRFPAGPMDWEIAGFRRSWFWKVPWADLPRTLYWTFARMGGLRPAFFMHVALRPRNRALILEREVRLAYYRIARSLALQPEMKGLLAEAWFHDPAAVKDNPHLEWLNEPYVRHGGFITTVGSAPPDSGVLEGSRQRQNQYEAGELKYRLGVAIWPRDAALHWAEAHPEFEGI